MFFFTQLLDLFNQQVNVQSDDVTDVFEAVDAVEKEKDFLENWYLYLSTGLFSALLALMGLGMVLICLAARTNLLGAGILINTDEL